MTALTPAVADLVALVGVKTAGAMIAEALAFLGQKYGTDLATTLEAITTTPNGRARFDELMAWNIEIARAAA